MLAMGAPAYAQQGGGNAYGIDGIDVDVVAPNIESARMAAYRIVQRKAWILLWSRLTGSPAGTAPRLSDGQIDSIVSGIESQGERFSTTRYIARLGVIFDRSRARQYLGGSASTLQSPPMLLMPVYSDGGVRTVYQSKTPWLEAWQRFRENVTPIDYVVASGSAGDNLLLTSWQTHRPDRSSWRNILNRFDAVDVLVAEARLSHAWPGGPVTALFIARHGPDGIELARFQLRAADDAGIAAMLDTGVRQIDAAYGDALRGGMLRSEPDLTLEMAPLLAPAPLIGVQMADGENGDGGDVTISSLEVLMSTPDAAAASALEAGIRGTPGVTGVTVTSLSLGGTSRMIVNHVGDRDALAFALDARGLRLTAENGEMVLRRRREGDPPLAQPPAFVTAVPVGKGVAGTGAVVVSPPGAPGKAPTPGVPPGRPPVEAVAKPALKPSTPAAPRPAESAKAPVELLPKPAAAPKRQQPNPAAPQ
jgi:hypothetical protein